MIHLQELTEKLAAAVLVADAEDLRSLALIHDDLLSVPAEIVRDGKVDAECKKHAESAATIAAQLIERILLREVTDTSAALVTVSEQIAQLQAAITGIPIVSTFTATPDAPPQETAAAAEHAPAEAVGDVVRPDDLPLIAEFIAEAGAHLESAEAALLGLGSDPHNMDLIGSIFRSFHTIKGVAGFLNLRDISRFTHGAESMLDLARQEKITITGPRLDVALEALDVTKTLINMLAEGAKNGGAIAPYSGLDDVLERIHAATTGADMPASSAQAQSQSQSKSAASSAPVATRAPDSTVKVTTERLDSLINMVGELVIAEAMVTQDISGMFRGNQRLARDAGHLGKITRELQDLTMSMRMVPIQGVFQKMSRLVRDLASKSGKEIELVLTGGETELDRNLVEALADPLVHMVRNSADHGVESAADRERSGKPRQGRIELKAYHQAGHIVIEISDDGRGLNKARILEKARKAGIIKPDAELPEQEIFKLIFHAGLSTAEKITDVSGRGVGMDVVRRNVESLRGRIDIASVEGKGSTFSIRLPLTLAVIDGLIAKVGKERYILPITSIEQSFRPKAEMLSTVQDRAEICTVRGRVMPIYRLHRLFNVTPLKEDPCEALIVIVQDNDRRCCLLVDELLGQQQVVIKSLDKSTGPVPGVSGGAILGDGTISLILDIPGLMDLVARN